jgi:hypothetical protein
LRMKTKLVGWEAEGGLRGDLWTKVAHLGLDFCLCQ